MEHVCHNHFQLQGYIFKVLCILGIVVVH
jgi:hypothetical protein